MPIAHYPRRERDKITDHAIMGDIGVDLAWKNRPIFAFDVIWVKPHKIAPSPTVFSLSEMWFDATIENGLARFAGILPAIRSRTAEFPTAILKRRSDTGAARNSSILSTRWPLTIFCEMG